MPRLQITLVLCLTLTFSGTFAAQQTAPPDAATLAKKVDEYMTAHVKVNDFSGTVLLAKEGTPLFVKGYGYANREWQIPNGPDTKFRIGSITKQFTSMMIMQLREQGKVKLEDSVCAYVARCPDTWTPVTIHHLLTHTSGIPSYTGLAALSAKSMVPHTTEQVMDYVRGLPLEWTPGERFAYNNSGYYLLGMVIEKITGKKYDAALQDMIVSPLDLSDTGYDWPGTVIPRRASGYQGRGAAVRNSPAIDMQQPYAAGAMYSTVLDLLRWEQMLYTEKLIPEASKQIMWTPVLNKYAYGWIMHPASPATFGHARMQHGGAIHGFSTVLIRVPEVKLTAIVFSNNPAAGNAALIGRDMLAIHYGGTYKIPGSLPNVQ
jgi:CubicO group peptidase (beta-lactamase class C family)